MDFHSISEWSSNLEGFSRPSPVLHSCEKPSSGIMKMRDTVI